MKILILPTIYGIFGLNEENQLQFHIFKDLSEKELAEQYNQILKQQCPKNLIEMLHTLKEANITGIQVESPLFKTILDQEDVLPSEIITDNERLKSIYELSRQYFMDLGVDYSSEAILTRTKVLAEFLNKLQISESATQKDFLVKQAVDTIVELDKAINFLSNRLREWYGLHFPELTDKLIDDNFKFAQLVAKIGTRAQFSDEKLQEYFQLPQQQRELLLLKANRSMGGTLDLNQFDPIKQLAEQLISMSHYRKNLEVYISESLDAVAPNLKAVLGAQITGKLIAIAGSLERLAHAPSSTIQLLGAEKALFKAIRSGGRTPKYGILFQWNKIRSQKTYLRGKIARMVAGKVSILAKVDFYRGEFIGDKYREMIDKKIEILQKQFPRPPKRKSKRKTGQQNRDRSHTKGSRGGKRQSYRKGKPYKSKPSHHRYSDNQSNRRRH